MIKQLIKYTDFNGKEQKEIHYFHVTKTEIATWEMANDQPFSEYLQSIASEENQKEIWNTFLNLVVTAYGIKSIDGKSFDKSPEIQKQFKYSLACDALIESFFKDVKKALRFAKGIMPHDMEKITPEAVANLPEEQQKLILELDSEE